MSLMFSLGNNFLQSYTQSTFHINYRNQKSYLLQIYLLFFIFLIHFQFLSAQNYSSNPRDDKKHYFCNGYLFDSDYRLSVADITMICNRLATDNRFFISIQKNIPFFSGKADDNLYTRDTEELFFQKCRYLNTQICNYGFIISIYTEARKIRISAGNISKNIVTVQMRENIIQNIKGFLSNDKFYDAILRAIDYIQSYSNSNFNQGNNKPTTIVPAHPTPKKESGWGFWSVLIFIICPILCICGAIYYFYQQKQEEEQRISIHKTGYNCQDVHSHLNKLESMLTSIKYNSPPYLSIDVCLICMTKILCANNYNNTNNAYSPPNANQVEMNVMNPYGNQNQNYNNSPYPTFNNNNNLNTSNNGYMPGQQNVNPCIGQNTDPNNTRFACGHVFHTSCLSKHGINNCMMCNDYYNSSLKVLNTNSTQVVDEYNIKKLMSRIDLIYGAECLKSYGEAYPEEVNRYDAAFGLGLVAVVGITAVAATAIVADSIMQNNNSVAYNQGYNDAVNNTQNMNYNYGNYQNQNNYSYVNNNNQNKNNDSNDNNPDTAEGDY